MLAKDYFCCEPPLPNQYGKSPAPNDPFPVPRMPLGLILPTPVKDSQNIGWSSLRPVPNAGVITRPPFPCTFVSCSLVILGDNLMASGSQKPSNSRGHNKYS